MHGTMETACFDTYSTSQKKKKKELSFQMGIKRQQEIKFFKTSFFFFFPHPSKTPSSTISKEAQAAPAHTGGAFYAQQLGLPNG